MTLSKPINKAVKYMGKDWRGGSNNQYPQHEPKGSIVRSLPNQTHLTKPTIYKTWETLKHKTICTIKVISTSKSDNKKAKLCEEYLNQSSTDKGGATTKFSREGANSKHTAKVRPLLDKLISRKIGQYIEIYQEIIGDLIDSAIDVGSRTSNNPLEIDLNPIKKLLPEFTEAREILKSFLTKCIQESYEAGIKKVKEYIEKNDGGDGLSQTNEWIKYCQSLTQEVKNLKQNEKI